LSCLTSFLDAVRMMGFCSHLFKFVEIKFYFMKNLNTLKIHTLLDKLLRFCVFPFLYKYTCIRDIRTPSDLIHHQIFDFISHSHNDITISYKSLYATISVDCDSIIYDSFVSLHIYKIFYIYCRVLLT
jgi:hypothetical protein